MVRAAVTEPTAEDVRAALEAAASVDQRAKIQQRMTDEATEVIGVRMGTVFDIAKANTADAADRGRPAARLRHVRGADGRASASSTSRPAAKDADRAALYDLWMRRLDRIDTWDYIDRSAPRVVGWYLLDKPRDVLFELARSDDRWHRRTAITAAFWIIRCGRPRRPARAVRDPRGRSRAPGADERRRRAARDRAGRSGAADGVPGAARRGSQRARAADRAHRAGVRAGPSLVTSPARACAASRIDPFGRDRRTLLDLQVAVLVRPRAP